MSTMINTEMDEEYRCRSHCFINSQTLNSCLASSLLFLYISWRRRRDWGIAAIGTWREQSQLWKATSFVCACVWTWITEWDRQCVVPPFFLSPCVTGSEVNWRRLFQWSGHTLQQFLLFFFFFLTQKIIIRNKKF